MSTIKHHHIKFKKRPPSGGVEEWDVSLKKVKGITYVRIDADKGDVFAEYDLLNCKEEDIERCMVDMGFVLDDSIMEKLKRGWIHFTEENEQAEYKHKAPSCCDVSEIEQKKKSGE